MNRPSGIARRFLSLTWADKALTLRLALLLAAVALMLKLFDFRRSWRLMARVLPAANLCRPVSKQTFDQAKHLGRMAASTARHLPFRATCLTQALTVWWLLRRSRLNAELRIGVKKQDIFAAHAWVEIEAHPVTDKDDIAQQFKPFSSLEA